MKVLLLGKYSLPRNGGVERHHFPVRQFFEGMPSYDTVRERILAVAESAMPGRNIMH